MHFTSLTNPDASDADHAEDGAGRSKCAAGYDHHPAGRETGFTAWPWRVGSKEWS